MLEIGSVVDGKYKILNKIGQGGMSIVYLAMNERANKQWAIKEVRKDGVENFEVIKQGQIVETNLLKRLNHPNLPSIVDVIDQEDSFLIVMDYIEGNPLSDALAERGALPVENVIEWAKQLCDVLEYLHTRKPPIIYRDMKPSNIMLKPDGTVMLIDFGIAREFKEKNVEDTTCLGTQGYAAPEQFGGQGQTDARTDIYCLGATIYHLVTGHNPSEPPYEMYPIRHWDPSFSSGLEKIILKCTQRNPQDRYQSCAELLYALEHYEEEDEEYKKVQDRKWLLFLSTAILTCILAIATIGCYFRINRETSNTYEEYLNFASLSKNQQEQYQYYENAIRLAPQREDAYEALFDSMEEDGVLSEEESEEIRRLMPQYMTRLRENEKAYINIAYQLGIMYFYYYEDADNMQNAGKWLNIAAGNTISQVKDHEIEKILGEKKAFRVRRLYKIAQYYRDLDISSKEGDYKGSYRTLWQDLTAVITERAAQEDNNVTQLVMYNFMAAQLALHAQQFKDAGVSKTQMQEKLSMLTQSVVYDKENTYEKELFDKMSNNIKQAEQSISVAFD